MKHTILIITAILTQASITSASPASAREPAEEVKVKKVASVASRGLTATLLGGGTMGWRGEQSHGFGTGFNGALGFELRLGRSPVTITPELLINYSRFIESNDEYGGFFAGGRLSFYPSADSRRGVMIWLALHGGVTAHTDDKQLHPTFLVGSGVSYMFLPHVGIGFFGDASFQTSGTEFSHTLIAQQGGGTLSVRFGLALKVKIPM